MHIPKISFNIFIQSSSASSKDHSLKKHKFMALQCMDNPSLPPQVMLLLSSKKTTHAPIAALHTAALLLTEAGEQMEMGKFDFDFFNGRASLETAVETGYDTDELEDKLE